MLAKLRSLLSRWQTSGAVTWFGVGVSVASLLFLVYLLVTTSDSAQPALLPARAESVSPVAASADAAHRPPSLARVPDAVDSPASAAATGAVVPRTPARPPTRAGATAPAPVADPPVTPSDAASGAAQADDTHSDAAAGDAAAGDAAAGDAAAAGDDGGGVRGHGGALAVAAALLAQATTTPSAVDLTPGPAATLDAAAGRLVSTAANVVDQMLAVADQPTPAALTPEPTVRSSAPPPRPALATTATPTPLLVVAGCPAGTRIDLNSATVTDLQALPGIGPAAAQRIVDHRQQTPFVSVAELYDLHLVSRLTFARIRDLVTVGAAS